jgi:collagenase-like PrtC family protease
VASRRRALEFHEENTELAEQVEHAHLEGLTKEVTP